MLEQYTGINIYDVPKNDQNVIKLFSSTEPIGLLKPWIKFLIEKTGAIGITWIWYIHLLDKCLNDNKT
nr:hypothetical protein [Mycoplasmopsis bovis]